MNVEEPEAVQCARVARNKKSNDGFARLSPMFARAPLDWLNFFLADVRGGLGAYVGVFLLTQAHWNQATIGAVLTVSGLIGITIHAPIGALIDATHHKRGLIIVGTCALAASALAIAWAPTFPVVLSADILMAVAGAIFAPTVAAITLGMTPQQVLPPRLGRNAAFDRAGNIFIAVLAGLVGWAFSQRAVFYLVPFFAVLTTLAVLSIPAHAIDHDRARGFVHSSATDHEHAARWRVLLERRPLMVLTAANALFHFANAPMLPLLGQKLALAHPGVETAFISACIITAQVVTIPTALLVGWKANSWGRKSLLLIGFGALPIRAALFTVSDNEVWLVSLQVLDGVAAGTLDALIPLVLADVMRGTGRYNAARGVLGTVQGIAGSLSNAAAGFLVVSTGYSATFLALSTVGVVAWLVLLAAMPETGRNADARKAALAPTD
jgi:MFS family permease